MQIIDITVPLLPGMPVWPGDPEVVIKRLKDIDHGADCTVTQIAGTVHMGTHVDAPAHFIRGGSTVSEMALEIFMGDAVVADAGDASAITPEVLDRFSLPDDTVRLLIKTKNSRLWDNHRHEFYCDFVALTPEAAQWIAARNIRLLGIDYLSVQRFADRDGRTHRILLEMGIVLLEGLDLRSASAGSYRLVCLPLNITGCEGAPARAVLVQG
ncbi:MAG: cyclase family protein [Desulfobacterota bacterium]|nr:cyclase family protein [Thermodesulfobacteriota bacterium]